jgi:hypothetical protein
MLHLDFTDPALPPQLPIFAIEPVHWDEARIRDLATRFGIKDYRTRNAGTRLIVLGEESTLEIFVHSDSFRWQRNQPPGVELRQPLVLTDQEAQALTTRFLEQRGLLAERWTPMCVAPIRRGTFPKGGGEQIIASQMGWGFGLPDGPCFGGPGMKMQVTLARVGDDIAPIECYRFFRRPIEAGTRTTRSASVSATADLSGIKGLSALSNPILFHYAASPRERQEMFLPCYRFECKLAVPAGPAQHVETIRAPAVKIEPEDRPLLGAALDTFI